MQRFYFSSGKTVTLMKFYRHRDTASLMLQACQDKSCASTTGRPSSRIYSERMACDWLLETRTQLWEMETEKM